MKKHILIIEDNEQNRYLATFLLDKRGYRVTAADNGPHGILLVRDLRPDLVLLDIQLPGMDGYEVARLLRADGANTRIPIVAVTSYAMPGDREQALAAGCDGYIEKPINPGTFVNEVETHLMRKQNGEPTCDAR